MKLIASEKDPEIEKRINKIRIAFDKSQAHFKQQTKSEMHSSLQLFSVCGEYANRMNVIQSQIIQEMHLAEMSSLANLLSDLKQNLFQLFEVFLNEFERNQILNKNRKSAFKSKLTALEAPTSDQLSFQNDFRIPPFEQNEGTENKKIDKSLIMKLIDISSDSHSPVKIAQIARNNKGNIPVKVLFSDHNSKNENECLKSDNCSSVDQLQSQAKKLVEQLDKGKISVETFKLINDPLLLIDICREISDRFEGDLILNRREFGQILNGNDQLESISFENSIRELKKVKWNSEQFFRKQEKIAQNKYRGSGYNELNAQPKSSNLLQISQPVNIFSNNFDIFKCDGMVQTDFELSETYALNDQIAVLLGKNKYLKEQIDKLKRELFYVKSISQTKKSFNQETQTDHFISGNQKMDQFIYQPLILKDCESNKKRTRDCENLKKQLRFEKNVIVCEKRKKTKKNKSCGNLSRILNENELLWKNILPWTLEELSSIEDSKKKKENDQKSYRIFQNLIAKQKHKLKENQKTICNVGVFYKMIKKNISKKKQIKLFSSNRMTISKPFSIFKQNRKKIEKIIKISTKVPNHLLNKVKSSKKNHELVNLGPFIQNLKAFSNLEVNSCQNIIRNNSIGSMKAIGLRDKHKKNGHFTVFPIHQRHERPHSQYNLNMDLTLNVRGMNKENLTMRQLQKSIFGQEIEINQTLQLLMASKYINLNDLGSNSQSRMSRLIQKEIVDSILRQDLKLLQKKSLGVQSVFLFTQIKLQKYSSSTNLESKNVSPIEERKIHESNFYIDSFKKKCNFDYQEFDSGIGSQKVNDFLIRSFTSVIDCWEAKLKKLLHENNIDKTQEFSRFIGNEIECLTGKNSVSKFAVKYLQSITKRMSTILNDFQPVAKKQISVRIQRNRSIVNCNKKIETQSRFYLKNEQKYGYLPMENTKLVESKQSKLLGKIFLPIKVNTQAVFRPNFKQAFSVRSINPSESFYIKN